MLDIFNKFYNSLTDEIYSIIEIDSEVLNPSTLLNDEKYSKIYSPIYLMTKYVNSRINHYEAAFKHTSGFYICLNRKGESEVFTLKVVYKIKQYEELKIFINNLKKIK
jgi:hypothetical protein